MKFVICFSVIVLGWSLISRATTFDLRTRFFDTSCSVLSFETATSFSSRITSGMAWPSARNSINTPIATAVMNCSSLRRWCDSWPSLAGLKNIYHSPQHPTATNPAATISQQTQNQKDGSKINPITGIEIVARIPQIIFGILLLITVCTFWKITFTDYGPKK